MPADSRAPAKTDRPAQAESNVKETVESILVAFILAFIFRAFVVEAFVIPTGSMAPTLMGAHMRFRCSDCGYRWDVNFSSQARGDDIQIPPYAQTGDGRPILYAPSSAAPDVPAAAVFGPPVHCPNCGYMVSRYDAEDPENDATAPPVHYGDRILVLKYLYLFQPPRRWDVIVFKSPSEIKLRSTLKPDPGQPRYGENYIKRLVGLPGEAVMILDGDVYVRAPGAPPDDFRIARKSDIAQSALWRVVYDNDYVPAGRPRAEQPWQQPWRQTSGTTGWDTGAGTGGRARVFAFNNASGSGELFFDPTANPATHALTDWLAYDQTDDNRGDPDGTASESRRNPVGDLKLACYYDRGGGDGDLRLMLTKGQDVFTARVTPGKVELLHGLRDRADAPPEVWQSASAPDLSGSRPVWLELANVDYRVSLRVNGREVLATTDDQYRPDFKHLKDNPFALPPMPEARVVASNQRCAVRHLSLWRDVYYLSRDGRIRWGTPDNPMELNADEYFVLGDNSLISGDARMWLDPIDLPAEGLHVDAGRVPARFLLGKAFFVYWPAGYRPFPRTPAFAPNFGDMRFIH